MPSSPVPVPVTVIIRPPDRKPYTVTLDDLTAHLRAIGILKTMGRLAARLATANDAIAGVEMAVEKDVEVLIERTKTVHAKREAAFMRKHVALDQSMTDLAEFEKDIAEFDGKNDPSRDGETSKDGDAYVSTRATSK